MSNPFRSKLRVAAIQFLNPAPLLYAFEHGPHRARLLQRYQLHYTSPALCAEQLRSGDADLGLVPIGAMPAIPELIAVPGCAIASLQTVRSIQLVLKPGLELGSIRTVAADSASRSSLAYVQVILRTFYENSPVFHTAPANLQDMLANHDAALLIGDPALLALEDRNRTGTFRECSWFDVAQLWNSHTSLPWVAAVWAVRPAALESAGIAPADLARDLVQSRDRGLANIETLVDEWKERIAVPANTIHAYLTRNIHYTLDQHCLAAVQKFYDLALQTGVLGAYTLPMLPEAEFFSAT